MVDDDEEKTPPRKLSAIEPLPDLPPVGEPHTSPDLKLVAKASDAR